MMMVASAVLEEGKDTADYMDSDRVIGKRNQIDTLCIKIITTEDEGKDAFNGMVAAVNSADEKMKIFTGELQKAIDRAVR